MKDLDGKAALVTGAGSGIGQAIAKDLAAAGVHVAVNDLSREGCERAASLITSQGGTAISVPGDVSDRAAVKKFVASAVEGLGKLDIVVNNAGIGHYVPFAELKEQDWDRMIAVHLKGTFNVIQEALPHLKSSTGGRIINMASVAGMTGTPTHCHYSAAKGGIIGLTKALAKEFAADGITVNALAPGLVDTPFADLVSQKLIDVYLERTPLKRMGTPEEVAWVSLFLASARSSFITGQVISPNGGFLIA